MFFLMVFLHFCKKSYIDFVRSINISSCTKTRKDLAVSVGWFFTRLGLCSLVSSVQCDH